MRTVLGSWSLIQLTKFLKPVAYPSPPVRWRTISVRSSRRYTTARAALAPSASKRASERLGEKQGTEVQDAPAFELASNDPIARQVLEDRGTIGRERQAKQLEVGRVIEQGEDLRLVDSRDGRAEFERRLVQFREQNSLLGPPL
jgi:hypothetical protein